MDSSCSICLQAIHVRMVPMDNGQNVALLDSCNHTFCKRCILEWMKKNSICPLCKRAVSVIISDILSPTEFSQFLPSGEYLYSKFCPMRRIMQLNSFLLHCRYSLSLHPIPNYEGEVKLVNELLCAYLRDWLVRELEVVSFHIIDRRHSFLETILTSSSRLSKKEFIVMDLVVNISQPN